MTTVPDDVPVAGETSDDPELRITRRDIDKLLIALGTVFAAVLFVRGLMVILVVIGIVHERRNRPARATT
jgi:hypothetical protein